MKKTVRFQAVIVLGFVTSIIALTGCTGFFEPVQGQSASGSVRGSTTGPVSGPVPPGTERERVAAAKEVPPERFLTPEVEALTEKVRRSPERYLEDLVGALTDEIDDPFLRVKALHDWIACNIDYDFEAYLGGQPRIVDPSAVLRRGATVCQGYSELFQRMALLAGIRTVIIQGYSRGYSWDPYVEPDRPKDSNHAWNGVEIEGEWYLIDCTWDAGYIGTGNVYTREYETGYFCTDPLIFLTEHFPDNPRWQLLEEPYSFEEFHEMPSMNGRCDELGISLVSGLGAINRVQDRAEIVLEMPEDVYVSAFLMGTGEDMDPIGYRSYRVREGERETHYFAFPEPGRYFLSMSAGRIKRDGTRGQFEPALSAYFDVESAAEVTYPKVDSEFSAEGLRVVSPRVPYDPDIREPFEIVLAGGRSDTDLSFELLEERRDGIWKPVKNRVFVRKEGAAWRVKASLPREGRYTLRVQRKEPAGERTWQLTAIAWFPLKTTVSMSREYPEIFTTGEYSVRYPIHSPLERGSEVTFEVASRLGKEVFIGIGGRIEPLSRGEDGVYTGTFTVNGDTVNLYYFDEKGGYYMPIAEYDVQ
jgi:hypothetical protein